MSLLQFCFLIFLFLGFYFWITTNWSYPGFILTKGLASFFVSFCIALIVFIGETIFELLGGFK